MGAMTIQIRFTAGAKAGQQLALEASPCIRIGRRPDNDVVFDPFQDLDVSGHHAELRQEADGYYLYDLGSSNGTFVGGVKVDRVRLDSGHEVGFGPTGPRMQVIFGVPAVPPTSGGQPMVAPTQASPGAPPAMTPQGHAPVGPMATPGPDGKVGQRTVAMMINHALAQSKSQAPQGKGKGSPTVFMRSMVNQAVKRSTVKFKIITAILLVLLIGAVGFQFAYPYIFPSAAPDGAYKEAQKQLVAKNKELQQQQQALRKEMTDLLKQREAASEEERKKLIKQMTQLKGRLSGKNPAVSGKAIVSQARRAVFVLAYERSSGKASGFCTAFAVRKRVLATNAHCIKALERFQKSGWKSYAVMNENPKERYKVLKVIGHPGYHKPTKRGVSRDVGALKVDRDLKSLLPIATEAELKDLGAGDLMFTYGFPGRLADVSSPSATLVQGIIGRVTRLNGKLGDFDDRLLVQYDATTAGGTSGSPVFNLTGKVIAVNAGGYLGRRGLSVNTLGYNFGIRIDVLETLLSDLEE